MFDRKKFGSTVRFIRKNKGLTILELALELNISDTYLSQIETGTKIPSVELVIWIINALGLTFEESNNFFDSEANLSYQNYSNMLYLLDQTDCEYLYKLLTNCEWKGDNN